MKVFLISGKAQHGKDTLAGMLKEELDKINKKCLIVHYADLLKYLAKQYFDWDGKKDEKGRLILQQFGTDVVRKRDPDFWVDFAIRFNWLLDFMGYEYIIIPDTRFPNEIEKMQHVFNCSTIRINRPNFDNGLTAKQKAHASETALDNYIFLYSVSNDKDFEKLHQAAVSILTLEGILPA